MGTGPISEAYVDGIFGRCGKDEIITKDEVALRTCFVPHLPVSVRLGLWFLLQVRGIQDIRCPLAPEKDSQETHLSCPRIDAAMPMRSCLHEGLAGLEHQMMAVFKLHGQLSLQHIEVAWRGMSHPVRLAALR